MGTTTEELKKLYSKLGGKDSNIPKASTPGEVLNGINELDLHGGFSGDYNDLTNKPPLGTASPKDVAASGDASSSQVVMGNDSRLTNRRGSTWGQINGTLANQTDLKGELDDIDNRIDSIIALPDGSTTADAELVDIRNGVHGQTFNSAGDAVRASAEQLYNMKTGFDGVTYDSPANQVIGSDETLNSRLLDYVYGGTKTFTISSTGTNKFKMLLLKGVNYTFTNNTSASCTLRIYKQDGTSLLISSGVSAGISIDFNPDAVDYILIGGWYDGTGSVSVASSYGDLNNPYIRKLYDYTSLCTWEIGSVYGSNGNDNDENQAAIRTPKNKKIFVEGDCIVQSVNEDVTTLYAFKYNTSGTFISRLGESGKTYINIDGGYVYRFVCFSKDSVVITSDTISHYSAEFYLCGTTLGAIIKDVFPREDYIKGYSIGADLIKRDIKAIRVGTGTLKYRQSFLMYNGKYYSTNGSKIAVQSSNFTVEQEVSLAVGHGNAFVLGTGNKGYISGWDDNTIYVIDLDNLTISSTITLPTTGYTTAAIDDVNEIIYIFQRDTSTSAESVYNYIVYDYANDSVIDTYKTTVPFSAMQACDILHDRIIVLNGYGTVSNPNGYRVYNLQGQILAEYTFDDLSGTEPEGVFIDRSTWDMYISDVDGKVYQITQ